MYPLELSLRDLFHPTPEVGGLSVDTSHVESSISIVIINRVDKLLHDVDTFILADCHLLFLFFVCVNSFFGSAGHQIVYFSPV